MPFMCRAAGAALCVLSAQVMFCAARLVPADITVGRNLQTFSNVHFEAPAPEEGVVIAIKSDDPARLLLSTTPDGAGSAAISVRARGGFRATPDFYVHGLGGTGSVTYTASAPGYESGSGKVTLAPSGFLFARSGVGTPALRTTRGAGRSEMCVIAALLDQSLNYAGPQAVAGGLSVRIDVRSSNPSVGRITASPLTIEGGSAAAVTHFEPVGPGSAELSLSVPPGFSAPAEFATIPAMVIVPGMAVTDAVTIGRDLEVPAALSLGEPAPAGGVTVTLASQDPKRLLLSATATDAGAPSLNIRIPAGGFNAPYYLQALGDSGIVDYSASAPGYRDRTGTIALSPSGLVIGGPPGPPDEAELVRKEAAEGPHGFSTSLAARTVPINVYTVQLDPVTLRGADLTVQPLRAGLSLTAAIENASPAVGTIAASQLTIRGGSSTAATQFTPVALGSTEISVVTPAGFTKSSNAASLTVKVLQ
jgi:hypothetical protein